MIIFYGGFNMSLVESSNRDNNLKSIWTLSQVELEGTRKEAFSADFSIFHSLSEENEQTCYEI